ncbi:unnamed protein product [Schistosoma curassoni]|uniref:Uncharacterized protein n=1 Tax=Schistosoma curassoni TaxID=6186 RepID=A0A183JD48_9TREM|nr:unnamed protein product [Schistosoma curassoni]
MWTINTYRITKWCRIIRIIDFTRFDIFVNNHCNEFFVFGKICSLTHVVY